LYFRTWVPAPDSSEDGKNFTQKRFDLKWVKGGVGLGKSRFDLEWVKEWLGDGYGYWRGVLYVGLCQGVWVDGSI
jgi:hypothetical protein